MDVPVLDLLLAIVWLMTSLCCLLQIQIIFLQLFYSMELLCSFAALGPIMMCQWACINWLHE